MERLNVKEIVEAVNGTLLAGDPMTEIEYICIDSREAHEGGLFVPIIGEKVDAHKFIAQVFDNGAAAVFMSHGDVINEEKVHILVKDTVKAMGDLATYYRMKFNMPIVGITGSVGKTSTKEVISAALETGFCTMKTAGNQNSQIGVPLTLFRMEKGQEMAVRIQERIRVVDEKITEAISPEKAEEMILLLDKIRDLLREETEK